MALLVFTLRIRFLAATRRVVLLLLPLESAAATPLLPGGILERRAERIRVFEV